MLVEALNLQKSFGGISAVRDVGFSIAPSTIVGLLGANGAGKSTTMRMMAGCLMPDAGSVRIAGSDICHDRITAQTKLGYLPEAANGFATLTVFEFLSFVGEARGLRGKTLATAMDQVIDLTRLEEATHKTLGMLSKGWRQRAWLAQALIHDPPVLILDEPTDGLDPRQKSSLRVVLRDLAQNRAIIMSTHILEEAECLCDRLVVMNAGCVVADSMKNELTDDAGRLAPAILRLIANDRQLEERTS